MGRFWRYRRTGRASAGAGRRHDDPPGAAGAWWPDSSSKRAGRGAPPPGRFDSYAAPSPGPRGTCARMPGAARAAPRAGGSRAGAMRHTTTRATAISTIASAPRNAARRATVQSNATASRRPGPAGPGRARRARGWGAPSRDSGAVRRRRRMRAVRRLPDGRPSCLGAPAAGAERSLAGRRACRPRAGPACWEARAAARLPEREGPVSARTARAGAGAGGAGRRSPRGARARPPWAPAGGGARADP